MISSTPPLETLFTQSRFGAGGPWVVGALVYFPIGLVLVFVRIFIFIQFLLAASLLPLGSFIRRLSLRVLSAVVGLVVIEENACDSSAKILVANHVTICDHLAVQLCTDAVTSGRGTSSLFHLSLGYRNFGYKNGEEAFIRNIKHYIDTEDAHKLILFPEEAKTNSKSGLLKLSSAAFSCDVGVQPVLISCRRPGFTNINVSCLASTFTSDLFWFLFAPTTIFNIRYLDVMKKENEESASIFSSRVQSAMCRSLSLAPTHYTYKDKLELIKKLHPPPVKRVNASLLRMAQQVKEVLPYVPTQTIMQDLDRTGSVERTISNVLEGVVKYTPLAEPSSSIHTSINTPTTSTVTSTASSSCHSSAPDKFHPSSSDRQCSFSERKQRMIAAARSKYLEKHPNLT